MKAQHHCDTCYDPATYKITVFDEDEYSERCYSCDACLDQYDEANGDVIDAIDL